MFLDWIRQHIMSSWGSIGVSHLCVNFPDARCYAPPMIGVHWTVPSNEYTLAIKLERSIFHCTIRCCCQWNHTSHRIPSYTILMIWNRLHAFRSMSDISRVSIAYSSTTLHWQFREVITIVWTTLLTMPFDWSHIDRLWLCMNIS